MHPRSQVCQVTVARAGSCRSALLAVRPQRPRRLGMWDGLGPPWSRCPISVDGGLCAADVFCAHARACAQNTPESYRTTRAEIDLLLWCPRQDSNLRHLPPESSALSTGLRGRVAVVCVQHSAPLTRRSRVGGVSLPEGRTVADMRIYLYFCRGGEGSESVGHDHNHAGPVSGRASGRYRRRLTAALLITAGFAVLQFVVALSTDSLALLSAAAHMFTDVIGLLMALGAILLAQHSRPTHRRTFGMYRTEVLAALGNAVLLFGVAGYVTYEAFGR